MIYVRARKGTVQEMRYHKCGQKGHLAGSCLTAGNSAIVSTDDKMDLGQQQPMPFLCWISGKARPRPSLLLTSCLSLRTNDATWSTSFCPPKRRKDEWDYSWMQFVAGVIPAHFRIVVRDPPIRWSAFSRHRSPVDHFSCQVHIHETQSCLLPVCYWHTF